MKARRTTPPREAIERVALRYLTRKDRTEAQMRAFLQRQGASADQAQGIVGRMRRLGYLNDETYAQRWAEDRIAKRPMGRSRLEAELLAQGFAQVLVEHTLNAIYRRHDERALATALLRGRKRTVVDLGRQARLLRSRGFDEDTIEEVLG